MAVYSPILYWGARQGDRKLTAIPTIAFNGSATSNVGFRPLPAINVRCRRYQPLISSQVQQLLRQSEAQRAIEISRKAGGHDPKQPFPAAPKPDLAYMVKRFRLHGSLRKQPSQSRRWGCLIQPSRCSWMGARLCAHIGLHVQRRQDQASDETGRLY